MAMFSALEPPICVVWRFNSAVKSPILWRPIAYESFKNRRWHNWIWKITSSLRHKHFYSMNDWRMVCQRRREKKQHDSQKKPHIVVKSVFFSPHTKNKLSRLLNGVVFCQIARKTITVMCKIRLGYRTHIVFACVRCFSSRQTLLIIIISYMFCPFANKFEMKQIIWLSVFTSLSSHFHNFNLKFCAKRPLNYVRMCVRANLMARVCQLKQNKTKLKSFTPKSKPRFLFIIVFRFASHWYCLNCLDWKSEACWDWFQSCAHFNTGASIFLWAKFDYVCVKMACWTLMFGAE